MYRSKELGKARATRIDQITLNRANAQLSEAAELRRAIAEDELCLTYQPIVDLRSEEVLGAEALLRWEHPGRGVLMPAEFLPIAEGAGLSPLIDDWVVRETCRQLRGWRDITAAARAFRVSINVTAAKLADAGFCGHVQSCLNEFGLEPSAIAIESHRRGLER